MKEEEKQIEEGNFNLLVVVLMGLPGSGKGSHSKFLKDNYNLKHISVGDLLREEAAKDTVLGKKIKETIDKGNLVSNDLILEMVSSCIDSASENGFIFDGIPRTLEQAEGLNSLLESKGVKDYHVIELKADAELIKKRITARFSCSECGEIYNKLTKMPKHENVCDVCKTEGKFSVRKDDTLEVVDQRLRNYQKETESALQYYVERDMVKSVNADSDVEKVFLDIKNIIDV